MKTIEEIIAIKLTLRTVCAKIKRIENANKKFKKMLVAKESEVSYPLKHKTSKRKINYFDTGDIEHRMRNNMMLE